MSTQFSHLQENLNIKFSVEKKSTFCQKLEFVHPNFSDEENDIS